MHWSPVTCPNFEDILKFNICHPFTSHFFTTQCVSGLPTASPIRYVSATFDKGLLRANLCWIALNIENQLEWLCWFGQIFKFDMMFIAFMRHMMTTLNMPWFYFIVKLVVVSAAFWFVCFVSAVVKLFSYIQSVLLCTHNSTMSRPRQRYCVSRFYLFRIFLLVQYILDVCYVPARVQTNINDKSTLSCPNLPP